MWSRRLLPALALATMLAACGGVLTSSPPPSVLECGIEELTVATGFVEHGCAAVVEG